MSYILDALKRADAERERGTVPGLRAQPAPLAAAGPQPGASNARLWLGIGAGLALAVLALLAWRMTVHETTMGTPVEKPVAQTIERPAETSGQRPIEQKPIEAPRQQAPPPAPAAVRVMPAARPASKAPSPPATSTTSAAASAATSAATPASAPASAPAAEARIPSVNELPDDIKRQLPSLSISGSIYSDNPAQRMLTIGSQVFQEGDKPAPDLVLERIGPKTAVFSYKGTRYTVAY